MKELIDLIEEHHIELFFDNENQIWEAQITDYNDLGYHYSPDYKEYKILANVTGATVREAITLAVKSLAKSDNNYLLSSPKNAERLFSALNRAKKGTTKPQTIDEIRQEFGINE